MHGLVCNLLSVFIVPLEVFLCFFFLHVDSSFGHVNLSWIVFPRIPVLSFQLWETVTASLGFSFLPLLTNYKKRGQQLGCKMNKWITGKKNQCSECPSSFVVLSLPSSIMPATHRYAKKCSLTKPFSDIKIASNVNDHSRQLQKNHKLFFAEDLLYT